MRFAQPRVRPFDPLRDGDHEPRDNRFSVFTTKRKDSAMKKYEINEYGETKGVRLRREACDRLANAVSRCLPHDLVGTDMDVIHALRIRALNFALVSVYIDTGDCIRLADELYPDINDKGRETKRKSAFKAMGDVLIYLSQQTEASWFLQDENQVDEEVLKGYIGMEIQKAMDGEEQLGEALDAYTDPDNPQYDANFTEKIKVMRPDWFKA